jgi:hypothetical protein
MVHNMSDNFLNELIKRYPNHFALGEAVKRFWEFKRERPNQSQEQIEEEFFIINFQFNP